MRKPFFFMNEWVLQTQSSFKNYIDKCIVQKKNSYWTSAPISKRHHQNSLLLHTVQNNCEDFAVKVKCNKSCMTVICQKNKLAIHQVCISLYVCTTGCSLNIVLFLKILWFFWTMPVLLQCGCSMYLPFSGPSMKPGVHTPRKNRERPESEIYFKISEKTQHLMNTL